MMRRAVEKPEEVRDRTVTHFLAATGIRATACCELKLDDIDLERREAFIRKAKGNKERVVFSRRAAARRFWNISNRPEKN
jgi:site-specific recombinase XerD